MMKWLATLILALLAWGLPSALRIKRTRGAFYVPFARVMLVPPVLSLPA